MGQEILYEIDQLTPLITGKRFLLVKDSAYGSLGIKDFFKSFPHVSFSDFTPNPLYEQVAEGVKVFNENGCELIVAVGGGSTIDVAKCIKLYCRLDPAKNYLEQEKADTGVPLIAIPTTAGTGSESTRHAVIYLNGAKQSISHASIIPDYAVLEPGTLKTLPVYQKKCTMLDALSQAIESWWSVNSDDESKGYSRKAVTLIKANWEEYIYENTYKSAKNIMEAANLAGRAINITATTAAHAMSYKLTSLYGLPHGNAVALCMPEVWTYMLKGMGTCVDPRGEEYLKATLDEIGSMIAPGYFQVILDRLGIEHPVAHDREEDLDMLAGSVNPVRLKNNPVSLSQDTLRAMYGRIIRG